MIVGLTREGAPTIRASAKAPEALAADQRGELVPILLAESQPQSDAALDGALPLVVVPELSPLAVGFLIIVDHRLELPPKVVGMVGFPWRCSRGGRGRRLTR